jgi:ribosome maturation factor RimP
MISEAVVRELIDEAIEGTEIFLVDLSIGGGNKINVLVDAIGGLPISDCIKVSRGIEHNLDREEQDFELNVSSPGLDKSLKVFKQYEKNIGRSLKITLADQGVFDAKVLGVDEPKIEVELEKVITAQGAIEEEQKGNKLVLLHEDIKEAKVNISFK